MKKLILISALLLTINGCGPSQKDKDIAAAACSEIMETFKSEEAKRLKIYNDARLELGMRPITSSDSKLFFDISVKYGGFDACMDQFFPKPPTPPTKAELEAQEEARKVAEEAEAARALAKKAEEAEAARKAEEERQYIAENTKTSYLSCPSLAQIKRRECISCERIKPKCPGTLGVTDNCPRVRDWWEESVGSRSYAYIELNKVDGDNPDKNKLLPSRVHFNIPNTLEFKESQSNSDGEPLLGYQRMESDLDEERRLGIDRNCHWAGNKCFFGKSGVEKINNDDIGGYRSHERCDSSNLTRVEFEDFTFCIGDAYYQQPYVYIYKEGSSNFRGYKIKESSSYGNEVIQIGDFIIDRFNLRASDDADDALLGRVYSNYQCEVVPKKTYDERIKELKTRVQTAADDFKEEKAAEEATRKTKRPQI